PTATTYAVTDQGSLDTSVFGVLTMALNRPAGTNHQVSPFAIPTGPAANGADSGFLISGPMFLQQMLLGGAQTIFNNAPASSFEITNDNLTVQNTADMIFGKFMMDNKNKGSISTGNFPAELDQGTVSSALLSALSNIGVDAGSLGASVTAKG